MLYSKPCHRSISAIRRRAFSATTTCSYANLVRYHFDTFKFVERLEQQNFTRQQSEAIMACLRKIMNESLTDMAKPLVTKSEQEKILYMYKVDFAKLKAEVQLLEKNDFSTMKLENERLQAQVEKLKQKLKDEISKSQASVRLDLNLEKGRLRDESSAQEIRMKETVTRIESEIAGLRTQMEATKFQILQYLIATVTGTGALFLAYLRMFR
ncbi:mitochondrion protein [Mycotypha africana]|uniref:mitochondrion protein n=1 Tax=Mycotypha africana TaxID=64632 RepID=UPI002300DD4A|nr:mitochondrion protein [Mycotypha africana]KAI8987585.1 mitochondrion protein [Mycotypha africana]